MIISGYGIQILLQVYRSVIIHCDKFGLMSYHDELSFDELSFDELSFY